MKYFLRYACMFCAMRLLWGFARQHKHAPEAPTCKQHVSGVLLSILFLLTVVPVAAAGLLGFYLAR